jgi:hypothetical protein
MFDDVERGTFPVEPAGEDALPAPLGVADVELDEGAGERLDLPRRRSLAGAKADDRVSHPHRLAGLEGQPAGDPVALVHEAEHGDPLRHRSGTLGDRGHGLRDVDGLRLTGGLAVAARCLFRGPVAARQRQQTDEDGADRMLHARSGVHAS